MSFHILQVAASALLLGAAACSSDGELAMGGGASSGGSSAGGGAATSGTSDGSTARLVDSASDLNDGLLATAGNVGGLLENSGGLDGALDAVSETGVTETIDGTIDPLARVTVGDETPLGAGDPEASQMLGLSVGSDAQAEGDAVTLGVLSDGQVLTASASETDGAALGDNSLLGLAAQDEQVLGDTDSALSVNALGENNTQGDALTVNALNGGDLVSLQGGDGSNALSGALESLNLGE